MQFDTSVILSLSIIVAGASFGLGWLVSHRVGRNKIASAEEQSKRIVADAERDAANVKKEKLLEVKDEWYRKKQEFEHDMNSKRNKLQSFEKQLAAREDNLERKVELMNKKERDL